ncbi:MAG: diaminopimelate dehydrogenase [Firmicutes bacterium]|nr:diaminopimelate dehydrogenase [Bacillota bacterium]
MDAKLKVAVVGYGNVGRYAVQAIREAPDMELVGVVRRAAGGPQPPELHGVPVVSDIRELPGVQGAVLCVPTRSVPEYAEAILRLGIHTVDSYDIHGELADLRRRLDPVARAAGAVAVISAGWDPGTDSILRAMLEFMAPRGLTYTNFGPGMSMGHTVAVKAIPGVRKALSVTIPAGMGVHKRAVYVELEPGADFAAVEAAVKRDPYFAKDETRVIQVEDVDRLIDMGHGVLLERKGASAGAENQLFRFDMRINNPALTAQVMVAALRAATRQQPGCYTLIEIPVVDFLPGDREEWIRRLV